MNGLNPIQLEALRHAEAVARSRSTEAERQAAEVLARNGIAPGRLEEARAAVRRNARVVVHFHPDRLVNSGKTVAESLFDSGFLTNQFETGISSGSLTPFSGGSRDTWEQRLFGGAYQRPDVRPADRPKYGALDLTGFSDGAAPRFGSCFFRLKREMAERCSFTEKDSHAEPDIFGTSEQFDAILVHLLGRAEREPSVLGLVNPGVDGLLRRIAARSDARFAFSAAFGRNLDDYVEAQIHGPINLQTDVDSLVADPSFLGTETGTVLPSLCERFGIDLDWHAGFMLPSSEVPDDFRGPKIPPLARHVAEDGRLTAAIIGKAAVSLVRDPASWRQWGTFPETLQYLKQLWHVLAHFGRPLVRTSSLIDSLATLVAARLSRLASIDPLPEDQQPPGFDRNDHPLYRLILEALEKARPTGTLEVPLAGKPLAWLQELVVNEEDGRFTALSPHEIRALRRTFPTRK